MPVDAHMEASQEMCRSVLMRVHLEALMRVVSPLENVVKQRGEEQVLGRRSQEHQSGLPFASPMHESEK